MNQPLTDTVRHRIRRSPLWVRRGAAFAIEIALVAASGWVPYAMGSAANAISRHSVPLNPILVETETAIARVLARPVPQPRSVAPLTNLLRSLALILPVGVAVWQLYDLGKTGQTAAKRGLGVQVVTATGSPPGVPRAVVRELVDRWGIAIAIAYLVWRFSGAFPSLDILTTAIIALLAADGGSGWFHPQGRTLHDRLAKTYVLDGAVSPTTRHDRPPTVTFDEAAEDAAIAAIVLSPEPPTTEPGGVWGWVRRHPGTTLLIASLGTLAAVLSAFVGTQIYIQKQANWREFQQQDNEVFLTLAGKLSPPAPGEADERRSAILALGTLDDRRAIPLLVDLLGQERDRDLLGAIEQALVSSGPEALTDLRRANQGLKNDLESLGETGDPAMRQELQQRLRATQRTIAKLLNLYSSSIADVDLGRTDLGKSSDDRPFTLILDGVDVAGVQFRGATLTGASFAGTKFAAAGDDGRFGTFDDRVSDLAGADLKDTNFERSLLGATDLSRSNLMRSNLEQSYLVGANLLGTNASNARLAGANLQGANVLGASITGADLSAADFSNANLREARSGRVNASGTRFRDADLTFSVWQEADLSDADLSGANLENADFSGANLQGANLQNARLRNANFRGAKLSWANLQGAELADADFRGAEFDPPESEGKGLAARSSGAGIEGANFSRSRNLAPNQLAYLCRQGAVHPYCSQ